MVRILRQPFLLDMVALYAAETLACYLGLHVALGRPGELILVGIGLRLVRFDIAPDGGALMLSILLGVLGVTLGLYKPAAILQTRRLLLSAVLAALCSVLLVWAFAHHGMLGARALSSFPRTGFAELTLVWLLLLVCTRLIYGAGIRSGLFAREVVVVGVSDAALGLVATIAARQSPLFVGRLSTDAPPTRRSLHPLRVVVAGREAVPGGLPVAWFGRRAYVSDIPTFWERQLGQVDLSSLQHLPEMQQLGRSAREGVASRAARRLLDVAGAGLLVILVAPVMAIAALAVKVESSGPVIYRQLRVGLDGQQFMIFKFRSMCADAECDGVAMFARPGDSRITRVGALIRRIRVDELPQLFNILRGDMSLVGPRPERPNFVARYEAVIPFYGLRMRVKPGLTGWAQVNSDYTASDAETREKLSYDLYYLRHRSLLLDLTVIVATIRVILFGVGAR